jgi:hypothetical protein
MFNSRWAPILIVIAVAALLGLGVTARSQMQRQQPQAGQFPGQQSPGQLPPIDGGRNSDEDTVVQRQAQVKQAEKRNEERQTQLVQDTARLFDLAKELKDQVGKTNKDVLSVDVVKKADEIEKLAKSVRDKMKAD